MRLPLMLRFPVPIDKLTNGIEMRYKVIDKVFATNVLGWDFVCDPILTAVARLTMIGD